MPTSFKSTPINWIVVIVIASRLDSSQFYQVGMRILITFLLATCSLVAFGNEIYTCKDKETGASVFTNIPADIARKGLECQVHATYDDNQPRSSRKERDDDVEEITNTKITNTKRSHITPSLRLPNVVQAPVVVPAFINQTENHFEFANSGVFTAFKNRWQMKNESIRILHLGDSHVRNGFIGEAVRRELQSVRGNAGRGMVFPYALAKTYPQSDYQSTMEGSWQSGNSIRPLRDIGLGVSGVVAQTSSTASAFTLKFSQAQPAGETIVKVFFKSSMPNLRLTASTNKERVTWSTQDAGLFHSVATFKLHEQFSVLRIDIDNAERRGQFELHGVNIEKPSSGGVVFNSFGVDGATLGSLSTATYLEAQLTELKPDLIVLDFGSNELMNGSSALSVKYQTTLIQIVRRLRAARPQMVIVFAVPQGMRHKGRYIDVGAYAQFIKKLAIENSCLFWNWYQVAGEDEAIQAWLSHGLANRDKVHLLAKGYKLKGELLAKALLNTLRE